MFAQDSRVLMDETFKCSLVEGYSPISPWVLGVVCVLASLDTIREIRIRNIRTAHLGTYRIPCLKVGRVILPKSTLSKTQTLATVLVYRRGTLEQEPRSQPCE